MFDPERLLIQNQNYYRNIYKPALCVECGLKIEEDDEWVAESQGAHILTKHLNCEEENGLCEEYASDLR